MNLSTSKLRFWGWSLLIVGGLAAILWHYWLVPFKRSVDYEWWSRHTPKGQWLVIGQKIKRMGLDHDSSIAVGRYGDELWMEWVVKTLDPDLPPGNCGQGQMHLPDAPYYLTNQRPPKDDDWKTWWSTNKQNSQFEWVRDGFKQTGLDLNGETSTNNIVALLKIIATGKPWYQEYNAKRWLRDVIHLEPVNFDLVGVDPEDREQATKGLVEYAVWLGENRYSPAVLSDPSSPKEDDWFMTSKPKVLTQPYSTILNLTPIVLMVLGWGMLRIGKVKFGQCPEIPREAISEPKPHNS